MFRKKLSRVQMMRFFGNCPTCTVVMEACAGSHFVARELATMGHVTKLISPQFVWPVVKSNKNDFVDAKAICEVASRPSMRFDSPETEAQQTLLVLHRMRESLVRDRTKTINQLHGPCSRSLLGGYRFNDGSVNALVIDGAVHSARNFHAEKSRIRVVGADPPVKGYLGSFRPQNFNQGEILWPASLRLTGNRGGRSGRSSAAPQNQDTTDCSQGRADQHTDFYFVNQVS